MCYLQKGTPFIYQGQEIGMTNIELHSIDEFKDMITFNNQKMFNKLGIKGSPTAELVFKNAPAKLVGDRKLGLIKYVMSLMNGAICATRQYRKIAIFCSFVLLLLL